MIGVFWKGNTTGLSANGEKCESDREGWPGWKVKGLPLGT